MSGLNWQMRVSQVGSARWHACSNQPSFWEVTVWAYDSLTHTNREFVIPQDEAPRVGDIVHCSLAWGY